MGTKTLSNYTIFSARSILSRRRVPHDPKNALVFENISVFITLKPNSAAPVRSLREGTHLIQAQSASGIPRVLQVRWEELLIKLRAAPVYKARKPILSAAISVRNEQQIKQNKLK